MVKIKQAAPAPSAEYVVMKKLSDDLKYWQRELRIDDIDVELSWLEWDQYPDLVARYEDRSSIHLFEIAFRRPAHLQTMAIRQFNGGITRSLWSMNWSTAVIGHWFTLEIADILGEGVLNELYEVSVRCYSRGSRPEARRGIIR